MEPITINQIIWILFVGLGVQAAILGLAIWAIKTMLQRVLEQMREHCKTVSGNIGINICALQKEDNEIWGALNKHGHKGLDRNGSLVTR